MTVAALAPAEPQGTRSAFNIAATSLTNWDALVRLTTIRRGRCAPDPDGEVPAGTPAEGRRESPLRSARSATSRVERVVPWAGRATAPAVSSPAAPGSLPGVGSPAARASAGAARSQRATW